MTGTVDINGQHISYEMRASKRAWTIRLSMTPEKGLIVHKGRRVRQEAAERFIVEKSEWVLTTIEQFKKLPIDPLKSVSAAQIKQYKIDALALAKERLEFYNRTYGFAYGRITIRDQKTRWGSCSRKGNLNFNYRIALLPLALADYIIVHELCHTKQMNHSAKFWELVSRTVPQYAACKKALQNNPIKLRY